MFDKHTTKMKLSAYKVLYQALSPEMKEVFPDLSHLSALNDKDISSCFYMICEFMEAWLSRYGYKPITREQVWGERITVSPNPRLIHWYNILRMQIESLRCPIKTGWISPPNLGGSTDHEQIVTMFNFLITELVKEVNK